MEIIVGTIIMRDEKILMTKESKEKCYGKWSFPAGHLEPNELICDGAKRETYEETGCTVELKKSFPVFLKNTDDFKIVMMYFLADLVNEEKDYKTDEILETKWVSVEEIKKMKEQEFRSSEVVKQIVNSLENGSLYSLKMVKDLPKM